MEVNELRKSVEFMSSKFNSLREELAHTRHELNSTQEEMKRLVKENDHLKQEVSDLQQYTRRDNIMLFGVPEVDEQSTYEVIDQISEVIGSSELVQHDVSIAHRIPSRPGKMRPIVIRFTKRRSRDEWLQLFRNEAKKDDSGPGIATKKVNRELPEGRITAGDQLTAVTRDLLNKTRDAARLKNYKFVWTRDGISTNLHDNETLETRKCPSSNGCCIFCFQNQEMIPSSSSVNHVINLSSYNLSEAESSILNKGLNFALSNPVTNLDLSCAAEAAVSKLSDPQASEYRKTSSYVKNSRHFVDIIRNTSVDMHDTLVSFDVVSLFTNVPVDEALSISQ
ncbi:hypothetical protein ANN_12832 [Periplaneta americana]|uniref:FP protein C-terminal domain-containing protein n=1 Tax=Periplaneta americana TaxID=6978 RepID=A0ABQ8THV3_PERAM|nr:hypothetical protein ANN_12832 [Periplaneta americana]